MQARQKPEAVGAAKRVTPSKSKDLRTLTLDMRVQEIENRFQKKHLSTQERELPKIFPTHQSIIEQHTLEMQAITSHMSLQLCMLQSLYDKATQQENIGRIKEREGHVCSKCGKVFLDGASLRTHLEVHEAHIKKIMIWREHNLQRIEQRKRRHLQDDFEGDFSRFSRNFTRHFLIPRSI